MAKHEARERHEVNGVQVDELQRRPVGRKSQWCVNVQTGAGVWRLGPAKESREEARRAIIGSLERGGFPAIARALEVGFGFRQPTPQLGAVEIVPSWRGAVGVTILLLENATAAGRETARAELYRMAEAADLANDLLSAAQDMLANASDAKKRAPRWVRLAELVERGRALAGGR